MPAPRCTAVVIACLLAVVSAACTNDPAGVGPATSAGRSAGVAPSVAGSPVPSTATTAAARPLRLTVPPIVAGEVTRVTYDARTERHEVAVHRTARAGRQYEMRAACTSAVPGHLMKYRLNDARPGERDDDVLISGDMPCDGSEFGLMTALPTGPVTISLGVDDTLNAVVAAYAFIAPQTG